MPAFPLSLRLLASPLWALHTGWERLVSRRAPVAVLRVGRLHPLPRAEELRRLVDAPFVRGLHVHVDHVEGGWGELAAVRDALVAVRKSGKAVTFELEHCGNAELYLASAGDRVWVRPMVQLHLYGVGAALRFVGRALERIGLRFDLESAGEYKSFGETFTRAYATPENREAISDIVSGLQDELEAGIANGRGLGRDVVRKAVLDAPLDPEDARSRGLVDGALYADAVRAELESRYGRDFRRVPFAAWHRAYRRRVRVERWIEARRQVAVVRLAGPVVDGDGGAGAGVIAANPVVHRLDQLAEDDRVAAVVLHIHSPGGSATASDVIWRAAERLGRRKPVIAALGDVAASGGYYIAVAAAEIVVAPTTLTGSIGVVGGKLVVGGALAQVGVHTELVLGAPGASTLSAETPFDPEQRARFRRGLQRFYTAFVERVSAGRRQPYAALEPLARGRVWTGRRAVELGLADRLGGVDEAVARAAQLAGVQTPAVIDVRIGIPVPRWMRIARALVEEAVPALRLLPALPPAARLLADRPGTALLLWPWELDID
jgi:protease-4